MGVGSAVCGRIKYHQARAYVMNRFVLYHGRAARPETPSAARVRLGRYRFRMRVYAVLAQPPEDSTEAIRRYQSDQHTHAGGHSEDSSTGVHGMLLFGEEVLYLSHLPMFASPHNFQVLLEVGLDDAAREAFLSDRHVAADVIHTFVPQPFPIAELAPRADGPARTSLRARSSAVTSSAGASRSPKAS